MTTARDILQDALTFSLNRLSPGESADADVLETGLRALNNIVDEWNGVKSFLFQTILSPSVSAVTTATGTLGTTWTAVSPGDEILGATYALDGLDFPLFQLTMQQYQDRVADKTEVGEPEFWAYDGLATVYFYPVPNSKFITLRTKAAVATFAAIDTDYSMPAGYKSALSACVAEALAFTMLGGIPQHISIKAAAARNRIAAQASDPAIIGAPPRRDSIIEGF